MNPSVAVLAYQNALVQLLAAIAFFEARAAMHFFRNQVMECERQCALAERAEAGGALTLIRPNIEVTHRGNVG